MFMFIDFIRTNAFARKMISFHNLRCDIHFWIEQQNIPTLIRDFMKFKTAFTIFIIVIEFNVTNGTQNWCGQLGLVFDLKIANDYDRWRWLVSF